MPFPVEPKFIQEAENESGFLFPNDFKNKMIKENGVEIQTDEDDWQLFSFLDKSDKKRISRTCNHILLETRNAKDWNGFPENAIAIATNGCGDYLILLSDSNNDRQLKEDIYIWLHETDNLKK